MAYPGIIQNVKDLFTRVTDLVTQVTDLFTQVTDLFTRIDILQTDTITAAETASQSSNSVAGSNPLPSPEEIQHALGEFWFTLDGTIPVGGLPHLGHLCARASYPDFWAWREAKGNILSDEEWIAYANSHGGVCPYYSYGDGSTTFRTPKYDEAFLKIVTSTMYGGSYGAEGLPNITGSFMVDPYVANGVGVHSQTGAFFETRDNAKHYAAYEAPTNMTGVTVGNFDASRSNSIYGASAHVTPKNVGVLVGVYAVGKLGTIGSTDAEALLAGYSTLEAQLSSKLNDDVSNLQFTGKQMISRLSKGSSIRKVDLSVGSSGSRYTAPANGRFAVAVLPTVNSSIHLYTTNDFRHGFSEYAIAGAWTEMEVSVKSGDVVELVYSQAEHQWQYFYFIFDVSEE